MAPRPIIMLVAALALTAQCLSATPAAADNPMGYRLLSAADAARLPHHHGALGMDIESAQEMTDAGMTFDLIRVKQVRPGSAGAQAGLNRGDEIIAVDGQVFPNLAAFAAYVGSKPPGSHIMIDYIPTGGGPGQAQRVSAAVGQAGSSTAVSPGPQNGTSQPSGMSTRTWIGIAAAALLGCYALGCFSSKSKSSVPATGQMAPGAPPQ